MKLWIQLHKNHKLIAQHLLETTTQSKKKALALACEAAGEAFHISRPMILSKHETHFSNFNRTTFSLDDFIGEDTFDTMTIEIMPDKKARTQRKLQ